MALSRPDITSAMGRRKSEALTQALETMPDAAVLTNCPSCIQGLGRRKKLTAGSQHILVQLARSRGGEQWADELEELCDKAAKVISF